MRFLILLMIGLAASASSHAQGLGYAQAALEAEGRRDFQQAISFYTLAIEAGDLSQENLADVYHYRGNARFFQGLFRDAVDDYQESLAANPSDMYVIIWRYLARARVAEDGRPELRRSMAEVDLYYWPGPVVSLFLGRRTPEQVIQAAKDPFLDELEQRQRSCEAFFYVGEYHLLKGEADEAAAMFRMALETGVQDFLEYEAAALELALLGR